MISRWPLVALLTVSAPPLAAQNPIVRVEIYTDANPKGLGTAEMDRPTWGTIRARVTRKDGRVDRTTAVTWHTQDSEKVRLRLIKAQSVAIEAPRSARLGSTRVIVEAGTRRDTLSVVVREGFTRLGLAPGKIELARRDQEQLCAWMVTRSGGRVLTKASAAVPYCVRNYPNK